MNFKLITDIIIVVIVSLFKLQERNVPMRKNPLFCLFSCKLYLLLNFSSSGHKLLPLCAIRKKTQKKPREKEETSEREKDREGKGGEGERERERERKKRKEIRERMRKKG